MKIHQLLFTFFVLFESLAFATGELKESPVCTYHLFRRLGLKKSCLGHLAPFLTKLVSSLSTEFNSRSKP